MARRLLPAFVMLSALFCAATAVHAASDANVEAVQRALAERGYDPGAIDGAMGVRTAAALGRFQRSVGLPDTGRIDDATCTALGLRSCAGMEQRGGQAADTEATGNGASPVAADTTPGTGATRAPPAEAETGTGIAPGIGEPPVQAIRDHTGTTPGTNKTESTRTDTASVGSAKPALGFATLGWHPPQTGTDALARFNAIGAPPEFKRGTGTLLVPKGEFVFVLDEGERLPGLDCDPGAGQLSIEFVFGPDGPVIFTPAADGEYCQAGIGIVIEVGRRLAMRRIDWGDLRLPQGTVRVTGQGLQYID